MFSLGLVSSALVQIQLKPHMTLSQSRVIRKGIYRLPSPPSLSQPAVRIKGSHIVIDFKDATIEGTAPISEPDQRKGLGVLVEGDNITIRNLNVRGYKVGLMARNVKGLKIENSDFSYNWKQHLKSTLEKEDLSDWMSYHHNEKDEWLQYGAGIYLRGCDNFSVTKSKAVGGQCGLMMTGCNNGSVIENNFSFLSGIGVGMYQSSDNRIMHNKIDWCVRGYSHGVYNRGQDSAGILVYEQSNRNTFAYNSVTHGGDGFFLWAGQTTMDNGQGGCNDNLLFGNDFSNAPTNGIEATFSRNKFVNNLVENCWHGIWGGYSYDSLILGNHFSGNEDAISIEHGQHNKIVGNYFADKTAIRLWQNKSQDPNWGYPKHHDTVSHDYQITDNIFWSSQTLNLRDTKDVVFTRNRVMNDPNILAAGEVGLDFSGNTIYASERKYPGVELGNNKWVEAPVQMMLPHWQPIFDSSSGVQSIVKDPLTAEMRKLQPKQVKGAFLPHGNTGSDMSYPNRFRGKQNILIDEWGPYDFKSPKLWPRAVAGEKGLARKSSIFGPSGMWRLVRLAGARGSSSKSGQVPGSIDIEWSEEPGLKLVELEYVGKQTTDYRGVTSPANKPVRFKWSKSIFPIQWKIALFKWAKSVNAADAHAAPEPDEFAQAMKRPVKTFATSSLDLAGYSFDKSVGSDHYGTLAEGAFKSSSGKHRIELLTDDGAQVWLDGKPIIRNAWKYQGPTSYVADVTLKAGEHHIRVEHFQIDGYAALKLEVTPPQQS